MAELHQQSVTVARELRSIWCDLLHRRSVDDSDTFFNLGGHSMLAMRMAARAEKQFNCKLELSEVFDFPVFKDLVNLIVERTLEEGGPSNENILPAERPADIPLSFAQQRMWFLDQLGADPASYIMSGALILRGKLDVEALSSAIRIVGRRHEVLRTTFYSKSGSPYQKIHSAPLCNLEVHQLLSGTHADKVAESKQLLRSGAVEAFDLAEGPLMRARLYILNDGEAHLLISMHHIISDGWSIGVLFGELFKIYHAFAAGDGQIELDPLAIQYADFSLWQRDYLQGEVLENQLQYWRKQLGDIPSQPILPTDRPRPDVLTFSGRQIRVALDADLAAHLRGVEQYGVSPFMFLLAAHSLVLQRMCGLPDLVVGTVIANRTRTELEPLIGFFVNTLAMRLRSRPGQTFRQYLESVRYVCYDAYAHQELPFERLVEDLKPSRDPAFTPIFQTLLTFNNTAADGMNLTGLEVEQHEIDLGVAKFELTVNCVDDGKGFVLHGEYNTALFDESTVSSLLQRLENCMRQVFDNIDVPLDEISMRSAAEIAQINALNQLHVTRGDAVFFDHIFAGQAAAQPDAIAVHDARREWTYAEINTRANAVANTLLERGAQVEDCIAMGLPRSGEAVISLIAIMRAGCCYLPIDLSHPAARISYMLQDSQARFIITPDADETFAAAELQAYADKCLPISDLLASENLDTPQVHRHLLNLAYSIYTSGSTGRPKSVLLTHEGLGNLLKQGEDVMPLTPDDRVHFRFSMVFDASIWMLTKALSSGARLYLSDQNDDLPGSTLSNYLREHAITVITLTPSMAAITPAENLPDLRMLGLGAEEVTAEVAQRWMSPGRLLFNVYGPTEVTVCSTACPIELTRGRLPIGTPFKHLQVFVVDGAMNQTPVGVDGELLIGGVGLARAYGNNPQLSALSFIPNPFVTPDGSSAGERLYRTGDRVRRLVDGSIEFRGRIDESQVKVRGFRIELGGIEAQLRQHPEVSQAAVVLRTAENGEASIVAWLRSATNELPGENALRAWLKEYLPEYMLPARFAVIDEFPLMPSGKVDRKSLARRVPPALQAAENAASSATAAATSVSASTAAPVFDDGKLETAIREIWSELLPDTNPGPDDNFFEIGGHSLLVVRVHALLVERLSTDIPVVDLFRFPTVRGLARHLRGLTKVESPAAVSQPAPKQHTGEDIAIIAMSARFPKASNVQEFWENIRAGRDCIGHFSAEELMGQGLPREYVEDDAFVPAKGVIPDADMFDADFFGMTPLEARLMAPHHRLFLEVVWECLESGAYAAADGRERIGVFAGGGYNTYQKFILDAQPELRAAVGDIQYGMGNEKDFLATFASYKLNLRGPSINVQNACSTSLVALHLACRALQNGDAEVALAGGATVHAPLLSGYRHEEGMIYSPDGHCRPFSDQAAGTVGSDGVVAVLLKPLSKALADGDTIHAVVKGSAVNNDGHAKVGFTAPGVDGQAAVIAAALHDARLQPKDIDFVETHGTATVLGDPIEIAALNKVYGGQVDKNQGVALASVKSNIGHTDTAAGLAGVVKTVMALKHAQLPPSLHYAKPNPKIDFAQTPFYVNTELREWTSAADRPRCAGVSSFGIGGTNAHVILQEFQSRKTPENAAASATPWPRPRALDFMLSARTPQALNAMRAELAGHLEAHSQDSLYDIAASLAGGRRRYDERWTARAASHTELIELLRRQDNAGALHVREARNARPLIFMFSGQGSQHAGMARALYAEDPDFRALIDKQAEPVNTHLRRADAQQADIRELLFPEPEKAEAAQSALMQTAIAQPALFMVEYALAQRLIDWGMQPAALVGHSIGLYCAAVLAGVMSLEDALLLVVERGRLMQSMAAGSMLTVMLPAREVAKQPLFRERDQLAIAAINTPETCVLSGPAEALAAIKNALSDEGVECRSLHTSHAFHSPMMWSAAEQFRAAVAKVKMHAPRIPILLDSAAEWLDVATAQRAETWSSHLLQTVQFSDCLAKLFENQDAILLEVGPGNALKSLALRHSSRLDSIEVLHCLPHPRNADADAAAHLRGVLAHLWCAGADLNWFAVLANAKRVPLPTYPFERIRHWADSKTGAGTNKKTTLTMPAQEQTTPSAQAFFERTDNISEWMWRPDWERLPEIERETGQAAKSEIVYLCEAGDHDADAIFLRESLRADANNNILQFHGTASQPQQIGDSLKLMDEAALQARLEALTTPPGMFIYALLLGQTARAPIADAEERRIRAFHQLHMLARVIDRLGWSQPIQITVLTQNRYNLLGTEEIEPDHALSSGPLKVVPQELPNVTCSLIDLEKGEQSIQKARLELLHPRAEQILVLRGKYAWRPLWHQLERSFADYAVSAGDGGTSTYLITGGFGAMGQAFGALLAAKYQAQIVLLSRRKFPERSEWATIDGQNGHRDIAEQIAEIKRWESLGATVMVLQADVSSESDLDAALEKVERSFGNPTGVIHTAGVPGGRALALQTQAEAELVFAPKLDGTLKLMQVMAARQLKPKFLAICSSMAAQLGGFGQMAYAAANEWQNAFAQSLAPGEHGTTRVITLDWGQWGEGGMAANADVPQEFRSQLEEALSRGIRSEEGAEAMLQAVASGAEQLVVNPYDWRPLLDVKDVLEGTAAVPPAAAVASAADGVSDRPALRTAYAAPEGEIELAVAATWTELLGVNDIGRDDDFFELGGHSLLATRVVTRLREHYEIEITLGQFFDAPTIAGLAHTIHVAQQARLLQAPLIEDADEEYEEGEL